MIARILSNWRFSRRLNRNLKARKVLRPQRQAAALKGWETRRNA